MTTDQRRDSLRMLLREYLVALDSGNEFVAELLSRCTLEPRRGSAVLLIPLAGLPGQRASASDHARAGKRQQHATASGEEWRHSGPRELDTTRRT